MSCRSTSAGSAFTSWARFSSPYPVSDRVTTSTFHHLREVYLGRTEENRRNHTDEEYYALLDRQVARVNRRHMTDAERASYLSRLEAARTEPVPDQATLYALFNITPQLRSRAEAQNIFCENISRRTRVPIDTVRTRFLGIADAVPGGARAPREGVEQAAALGLSRDAGTVAAMQRLESETRHQEAAVAAASPQRITRQPITGILGDTHTEAGTIVEHGYDPRNGRLEVGIREEGHMRATIYSYQNIPRNLYHSFISNPGNVWSTEIRGNVDYQYSSEWEATLAGAAPRCEICGQFADASHGCPPAPERFENGYGDEARGTWTYHQVNHYYVADIATSSTPEEDQVIVEQSTIMLPLETELISALNNVGGVEILLNQHIVHYPGDWPQTAIYSGYISGSVMLYRDENTREIQLNMQGLVCNCRAYQNEGTCVHMNQIEQAVTDRVLPPAEEELQRREAAGRAAAVNAAAERIRRELEEAIAADWTRNETTAAEAAATWRRESEVLYSEDLAAFITDVETALAARRGNNGNPVIPYQKENVLDGLCQRGSGQAFGIEIEYSFPEDVDWEEANERIAEELHAAGLTYSNYQQGYRASAGRGFRDTHSTHGVGNWSFEDDGSVSGELVSPGMYDEPETWEKLELALTILKRNGAVASVDAGAHVHVGTGNWHGTISPYVELARIVTQHEDAIVRLGSSTDRGTHRNNGYSNPMGSVPPAGFQNIREAHQWQGERYSILNLNNCGGSRHDHPEFRVFDATLDPGTIQAQIKLAVALTAAAGRISDSGGTSRGAEKWGSHARRGAPATPQTAAEIAEDSATVRSLLDTLFRRKEDKAQMAAVFANTRWTIPRNTRH